MPGGEGIFEEASWPSHPVNYQPRLWPSRSRSGKQRRVGDPVGATDASRVRVMVLQHPLFYTEL